MHLISSGPRLDRSIGGLWLAYRVADRRMHLLTQLRVRRVSRTNFTVLQQLLLSQFNSLFHPLDTLLRILLMMVALLRRRHQRLSLGARHRIFIH